MGTSWRPSGPTTAPPTYAEVAALIGAGPGEIALVENATFAWHQAFWSLGLRPGDRVLTGNAEYTSGFVSMLQAERRLGVTVEVVPDDEHGQVSVEALGRALDDDRSGRVGLVAITHVPTNGGLVNPAAEIGRLTRAAGVPYLLDACQSVGQMPVDVEVVGCDLLSATGRKFLRAPRGTGFLYVRRSLLDRTDPAPLDPAFLDLVGADWVAPGRYELRADARRFENWETSEAARTGLRTAVAYARSWGLDAIADAGHVRRRRPARPAGRGARGDGARPGRAAVRDRHVHARRGDRRRRRRRRPRRRCERLGVEPVVDPPRRRGAPPARPRSGVGPLRDDRRRARPAHRRGGGAVRPARRPPPAPGPPASWSRRWPMPPSGCPDGGAEAAAT